MSIRLSNRHLRRARRFVTLTLRALEERIQPATFFVTNTLDGPVTAAGQLPGSLRQAIFDANASQGADTIDATGVSGIITLTAGEFLLTNAVSLIGPGAAQL